MGPDFAKLVTDKIVQNPHDRGILICRNGIGMCLAANKIERIRCGISWNASHAATSRKDDNTNILALPADYIHDQEAFNTVETWLNTSFSKEKKRVLRS